MSAVNRHAGIVGDCVHGTEGTGPPRCLIAAARFRRRVPIRLFGTPVRDTQCGFKMFRREAALRLFAASQETGYLLDVELLVLARRLGYRVAEVPVNWSEVPGSKLSMARDWRAILTDLWRLRRRCLTIRGSGG
jgi:hypothetical protein